MKSLILFLLIGSAFSVPLDGSYLEFGKRYERQISDSFRAILEQFRELLLNGDAGKDFPVMDPLIIDNYNFEFDSLQFSLTIKANNIALTGLAGFDFHNMELSKSNLEMKFDFTLPILEMDADKYTLRGLVFGALPIYGSGRANFKARNVYFSGTAKVAEGPAGVYISDMSFNLSIDSIESHLTGMLGGGDIDDVINEIIQDLAPEFVNENSELISDIISGPSMNALNRKLEGMTLDELADILN